MKPVQNHLILIKYFKLFHCSTFGALRKGLNNACHPVKDTFPAKLRMLTFPHFPKTAFELVEEESHGVNTQRCIYCIYCNVHHSWPGQNDLKAAVLKNHWMCSSSMNSQNQISSNWYSSANTHVRKCLLGTWRDWVSGKNVWSQKFPPGDWKNDCPMEGVKKKFFLVMPACHCVFLTQTLYIFK